VRAGSVDRRMVGPPCSAPAYVVRHGPAHPTSIDGRWEALLCRTAHAMPCHAMACGCGVSQPGSELTCGAGLAGRSRAVVRHRDRIPATPARLLLRCPVPSALHVASFHSVAAAPFSRLVVRPPTTCSVFGTTWSAQRRKQGVLFVLPRVDYHVEGNATESVPAMRSQLFFFPLSATSLAAVFYAASLGLVYF
jgi:hypothetical protein